MAGVSESILINQSINQSWKLVNNDEDSSSSSSSVSRYLFYRLRANYLFKGFMIIDPSPILMAGQIVVGKGPAFPECWKSVFFFFFFSF
jgi:hypothetical protein